MKKILLLLTSFIMAIQLASAEPGLLGGLLSAKSAPESRGSESEISAKATNSIYKFNFNFAGGTPFSLINTLSSEEGRPKQIKFVIPKDCENFQIPAFSVYGEMTLAQFFETLIQASKKPETSEKSQGISGFHPAETSYGFKTTGEPNDDSVWYFYRDKALENAQPNGAPKVCKFYQLQSYLDAGYKIEDITTAAKMGWMMLGLTNTPEFTFHKDTQMLIVVGEEDQVRLIGDVLQQLSEGTRQPAPRPKHKPSDGATEKPETK